MHLVSILDFFREGVELADCLHGFEGLQVRLDLLPLLRIFFGDDRSLRISVVRCELVFELVGDNLVRVLGDHVQELGIGFVSQRVSAGFDDESGIEIAIG